MRVNLTQNSEPSVSSSRAQSVMAGVSLLALVTSASCGVQDHANSATTTQAVVTPCLYPAPAINFENEMVIRQRQVVEDTCRTTWSPSCPDSIRGRWTFGYLMAAMSGTPATANPDLMVGTPQAKLFVGNWLKFW